MGVIRKQLRIGGMSCVNCQNKIENKLKNTAGIQKADVSYNNGIADIAYDSDVITLKDIGKIIEKLDYEMLTETDKSKTDMVRIISLPVIIVSLYVLLQQLGILNLLVPSRLADTKMGYGMLFIVGLLTSVHCIAMCGGINISQCILHDENENANNSRLGAFLPAFLYNLGRMISYTAIGFFLGLIGMLIGGGSEIGLSSLFQGILKIAAGIFMVIMGINMLEIFPWLRRFNPRVPQFISVRIGRKKEESRQSLIVGLLNGLMPCGPLQAMQIVALASGNPFAGALAMLLFSLGTVPFMLGLGTLVSALGKRFSQKVMSVGAVLVAVLGLAMLSQGGSLSGLILPNQLLAIVIMLCIIGVTASIPFNKRIYKAVSITALVAVMIGGGVILNFINDTANLNKADMAYEEIEFVDGVHVVKSTISPGRYPNITVQAGIPVKWIIDAPTGAVNGCNYKMILKEYGIEHMFSEGENIIEFIPAKSGTVQYTCWMGMICGNIFVTNENGITEASLGRQSADVPVPSGYQIPSDKLSVAQPLTNENGQNIQKVSIELTENGFSPAVVVVQQNIPVTWSINNTLSNAEEGMQLLVPVYSQILELIYGENILYLYPQESFEVSTGDNKFYAYVKVVDDVNNIDETAIRQEIDAFEPLIYPDIVFESLGMGCCGGY